MPVSPSSSPAAPWKSWLLLSAATLTSSYVFDMRYLDHNLNQNPWARGPMEYSGKWENHDFHPSPQSWRFPFYTLFLDRFANGDPTNDNANGTLFEQDVMSTQLRFGGDVQGLMDSLDYIQGMGVKGLYIAGSPFMNQPWVADSYSPLDHTILDSHFGNISAWRSAIDEIHRRGMYILLDNTLATMGDLLGFEGYLNESTPFDTHEYPLMWKSSWRYADFDVGTAYNETCHFPRMWNETGFPVDQWVLDSFDGCYDGDFDQFGDTEAFGVYPDYRRQLTKFASVQDRLREWVPSVRERLGHFTCITIAMLDVDGFRYDKATQATLDASGNFSAQVRECARALGKDNFFLPGEITGGNTFGALYLGRGRQPDQYLSNLTQAAALNNYTAAQQHVPFLREEGQNALDAAAFHYSIYRFLTRFLGMDGNLAAGFDLPPNWVDSWNQMLLTNDFVNPDTHQLDPRHMYGATNQDVFRWPAITQGTERMLLGMFITTLHMPGIPLLLWGEEQAFTILDSTADNYIYGRQSMTASPAWQAHGCYALGSAQYYRMPLEAARTACHNEQESWDHRDPSHPIRNIVKAMHHLRTVFPVLNDGFFLQQLSNMTKIVQYPGSSGVGTETGLFSVLRSAYPGVQDLGETSPVWFVYHNDNGTATEYTFDCSSMAGHAIVAPFDSGTTVKNLFFPHDEIVLKDSTTKLGINGSTKYNGCTDSITLRPYEFRAYVPIASFVPPPAMITKFLPGHDAHIDSATLEHPGQIQIELHTSAAMDCDSFTDSIEIYSINAGRFSPTSPLPIVNASSVVCANMTDPETPPYVGALGSAWSWSATLLFIEDGIHEIVVRNATTADLGSYTNSVDRFLIRLGDASNPVVFPRTGNYSNALLNYATDGSGRLTLTHNAPGASKWRYTLNWGSSWSDWREYVQGHPVPIESQPWSGTTAQEWEGEHVIVQYWSQLLGSSSFVQHGDLDSSSQTQRRFPHLFANGKYNMWGFDAGIDNTVDLVGDGMWEFHFAAEWPATLQLNVWGMNPDGSPDQGFVFGDIDNDFVLDRLPPSSLVESVINITSGPAFPGLAYKLRINDGNYKYELVPQGSAWQQLALYAGLWVGPILGGIMSVLLFKGPFYKVKFVKMGLSGNSTAVGRWCKRVLRVLFPEIMEKRMAKTLTVTRSPQMSLMYQVNSSIVSTLAHSSSGQTMVNVPRRRTVLIATMEYNIDDWDIKIKIGGLGVMAGLMGKSLEHQDLVWVVPCVSGIEYPIDTVAEPMTVTILNDQYEVKVQYHKLGNITFVLLDAPVFRKQTKAEPYPPRMDDLESAVYYSAWNQCIAEAVRRFDPDCYHCNDYHGAAALLYLLPRTVPACLSLHNAEFQGMWPMRTPKECQEVCSVFNLDRDVVARYIQFGSVFNLLHAGASYLRIHQRGFGAVGVSKKYGDRSFARYAIFWGLDGVGQLPNPDPTDTADWDKEAFMNDRSVVVDAAYEAGRADLKRQAQEWAGLIVNPKADLFVFVGRWSLQKGVDLIADIFPSILEQYPDTQLICIGPLIDLYGKFAALKLSKLMDKYPGRVYSKPEFTALPPFIFSGAEFALIPSRDEPFGLVAVEFGRKGALGVGARVGGLGQMPGWWYTIESMSASHLLAQFKEAIVSALETKQKTRAKMRAWSAKQRFPVAQWLEDLEILQSTAIAVHGGKMIPGSSSTSATTSTRKRLIKKNPKLRRSGSSSNSVSTPPLTPPGNDDGHHPQGHHYDNEDTRTGRPETGKRRRLSKANPNDPESRSQSRCSQRARLQEARKEKARAGSVGSDSRPGSKLFTKDFNAARAAEARAPPRMRRGTFSSFTSSTDGEQVTGGRSRSRPPSMNAGHGSTVTFAAAPLGGAGPLSRPVSILSLKDIVGPRTDFELQNVSPFFTDSTGDCYNAFSRKLDSLTSHNSSTDLCIEDYLIKSEKEWFTRYRNARLGRLPSGMSSTSSTASRPVSHAPSSATTAIKVKEREYDPREFGIGEDYKPPIGLQKWLSYRIGDWPIYSMFLALGQVISSNSYQITLLTGEIGQTAEKLYIIASVYFGSTVVWYIMVRRCQALYALTLPFFVYGAAFVLLGCSPFASNGDQRWWMQNGATALYATASSSGAIAFASNFGDEGGSPLTVWIFRATIIQGLQQLYSLCLWYWGSIISSASAAGQTTSTSTAGLATSPYLLLVCAPVAVFLWAVGLILYLGLPQYYREAPGAVPMLWRSLLKRKTIAWFFLAVCVQNYFLSAPYGRNWTFLFNTNALNQVPVWSIILLALGFFVVVWSGILLGLSRITKSHPWLFPIFAIGLGAPRWAQEFWGVTPIGLYLPWVPAGGAVGSALASRALWLWLGVLDGLQGAGIGMILMLTLTRVHVLATVIAAQLLGTAATIAARAMAPNNIGPGDVFPDMTMGFIEGVLYKPWFWGTLGAQLALCVGYLKFFRKEQVNKP
ncbi:putative alpha-1,3-glucan synthase [Microdochium trichocladiopsis]|uniref:alpha-1,3-glucan synthase n=1 Tax=Microdochium trichocladiopsis TaxID=1682393 RepID=A0A9P8XXK8_9PEZI|nr:putative alpha-1,3-glucan synthase [Microdochium trichocladiopsis]KAH7024662.1 putative alpha-1,3-glucan synthase [Microdochium trichocladiopsis]